jgi:hypothetical protein
MDVGAWVGTRGSEGWVGAIHLHHELERVHPAPLLAPEDTAIACSLGLNAYTPHQAPELHGLRRGGPQDAISISRGGAIRARQQPAGDVPEESGERCAGW